MEIPVEVLKWFTVILLGVQGLKKLPWLEVILSKWLGSWAGLILPVVAALVAGLVEYSGDGTLTGQEALEIVSGTIAAMGAHRALRVARDSSAATAAEVKP